MALLKPQRSFPWQQRVASIMEEPVVCMRPDDSIDELLACFAASHVREAPVVDAAARLVGFVSLADLPLDLDAARIALRVELPSGGSYQLGAGFHLEPEVHTVGEVMSVPAISLHATSTLTLACALMSFEGLSQLPIVDDAGHLVGILSSVDLLRWLARQDGHCIPEYTQRAREGAPVPSYH
jgi:CBS-domain-containing membrane protein